MSDGPTEQPNDQPEDQPTGQPNGQPDDQPHDQGGEQIGSAAEEAAKLFAALGEWAKDHSSETATAMSAGLAGLAGHAAAAANELGRNVEEHLDTGAPECTYCPVCRTVHVVREASPEVRAHLASAAASLMQAAASVLEAAGSGSQRRAEPGVEKIDLDDSPESWPESWEDE